MFSPMFSPISLMFSPISASSGPDLVSEFSHVLSPMFFYVLSHALSHVLSCSLPCSPPAAGSGPDLVSEVVTTRLEVLNGTRGDRPDVTNLWVVLTDQTPDIYSNTSLEALVQAMKNLSEWAGVGRGGVGRGGEGEEGGAG